jgi:hypothetical protein
MTLKDGNVLGIFSFSRNIMIASKAMRLILKKFGAGDRGRTGDVNVIFGTSPNRANEPRSLWEDLN